MFHVSTAPSLLTKKVIHTASSDLADYIYEHPGALNLTLNGFFVADRTCCCFLDYHTRTYSRAAVLGWDVVQEQIPAVNFVHKYENVFAFK